MLRESLKGKNKAAILLLALGPDLSARVFKHLNEKEIEELTLEIANLQKVSTEIKDNILDEFYQLLQAKDYINRGGIEYAREVLEKAVGSDRARIILERLMATLQVRPFDNIRKTDPPQLLSYIQNEHPQTIAMVMTYLQAEQASQVLSSLPQNLQADISRRIALMDRTSPEIIKEVESVLEQKLSALLNNEYTTTGGIDSIVNILNLVDRGTEKNILDQLEEKDPELASEIKKRMFIFEDIILLDDRAVQLVLRQVESHDIALALKTASGEVENKIFSNMSKRAGEILREDIEYMGPVRLREVEEAQQKIVNVIRQLEDSGEIVIARGGESEIIV